MADLKLFDQKEIRKQERKLRKQEMKKAKMEAKARKKEKKKGMGYLFLPPEKKSYAWVWILLIIVLIAALVIYVTRDNQQLTVHYAEFEHEQIPEAFDGYRILQITDLHGKTFGTMQKRLASHINSLEFDMILMTGDYLRSPDDEDYYVIIDLIDSIEKEVPIYYILGETDYRPDREDLDDNWNMCIIPSKKTPLMEKLKERGCSFVYPIQRIEKGGEYIYLTGTKYYEKKFDELGFDSDKHFSICVTHKPINYNVQRRLDDVNQRYLVEVDFDASISGHTIGGHARLPLLGAFYTDDKGLLPEEKYAYGLSVDNHGRLKFISSGLGIPSSFRLRAFNTPEVAIITLKHKTAD